jgi:hypothetical protein
MWKITTTMKITIIWIIQYFSFKFIPIRFYIWKIAKTESLNLVVKKWYPNCEYAWVVKKSITRFRHCNIIHHIGFVKDNIFVDNNLPTFSIPKVISLWVCAIFNKNNFQTFWVKVFFEFFGNVYIHKTPKYSKTINKRFLPYPKLKWGVPILNTWT